MKQITFNWEKNFEEYLHSEGIQFFVSDADIVVANVDDNSNAHAIHHGFTKWLYDNRNDMTLNQNGNGVKYHRG